MMIGIELGPRLGITFGGNDVSLPEFLDSTVLIEQFNWYL